MSASMLISAKLSTSVHTSTIRETRKSTGLKSIDQLIARYSICLPYEQGIVVDNPFQKTTTLYGQDHRLAFMNLPYCMYKILSEASEGESFTLHRFYLPHKKGVRFATYLLDEHGEMIESVCYQRNAKYSSAFKVLRGEIKAHYKINSSFAA